MIEKFEDYLGSLQLTKVVKDRIEEIIILNRKIKEMDILDIFICELKNKEGSRNYTSLWLFGEKYCIECKSFLTKNDFDLTPIKNKIDYCSISPIDFDLENTTEKSIVNIHFKFVSSGTGMTGNLIATEINCLSALNLYRKYIISNLK